MFRGSTDQNYSSDYEVFKNMYVEKEDGITQADAQHAFSNGLVLGNGAYGMVKYCILHDNPVIVKKFESSDMALLEYHAHNAFYDNISDSCKEYFAKPLPMKLSSNIYYTIHTPLHDGNEIIGTFNLIRNVLNINTACTYVLFSIQEIINCLDSLSIAHGDIKSDNVVVILRDLPVIRIIDFGCTHEKGEQSNEKQVLSMKFAEMFDYILTPDNIDCIEESISELNKDAFTTLLLEQLRVIRQSNKRKRNST